MLIDAKLGHLGDVLSNKKVRAAHFWQGQQFSYTPYQESLVTKGVASVKSSVRNLKSWTPDITHESFTLAVIEEFNKVYRGTEDVSASHEHGLVSTDMFGSQAIVVTEDLLEEQPEVQSVWKELQVRSPLSDTFQMVINSTSPPYCRPGNGHLARHQSSLMN